jgi:succinate dehydrogenase flavin-adding protein (antitoxin of CptAB toxin-antitoxin module)
MSLNQYNIEGTGPAARFTRTLQDAGFDVGDERAMQFGMIAYNTALMVWKRHNDARVQGKLGVGPATGRNSPCSCGSGKKYKKCCLAGDEVRSRETAPRQAMALSPNLIPRLASDRGMADDCRALSQVMDKDEDLKKITFSVKGVEAFLARTSKERKLPRGKEALEKDIDELAIHYARESGEGKILERLTDRFLEAATRVTKEEDLRGLAAGICFAMMAKSSKDYDDNILNILIFRRTLTRGMLPNIAVDKIIRQLGGDVDELRDRFQSEDPSLKQELLACMDKLSESERNALTSQLERHDEELWAVITEERFPVSLPFATMLPFWIRVQQIANHGKEPSVDELRKIMDKLVDGIDEEDSRLYGSFLSKWQGENRERDDDISRAVGLMATFCMTHAITPYVAGLVTHSKGAFSTLGEDEELLIEMWPEAAETSPFCQRYGDWLRSEGYPRLADRTLILGGLSPQRSIEAKDADASSGESAGLVRAEKRGILAKVKGIFR